jgi:hypothetical protein
MGSEKAMGNIGVDDKAREYILKMGGIITITRFSTGGWGGLSLPRVRLVEPDRKESYKYHEYNGVKMYVAGSLQADDEAWVVLNSFFGFKSLDAVGFKVL